MLLDLPRGRHLRMWSSRNHLRLHVLVLRVLLLPRCSCRWNLTTSRISDVDGQGRVACRLRLQGTYGRGSAQPEPFPELELELALVLALDLTIVLALELAVSFTSDFASIVSSPFDASFFM